MDCNWCAACSKHFYSESQSSLYCSEECRKADALACCAFHECEHPDTSTNHDHLTFCHHHRPAVRIPSYLAPSQNLCLRSEQVPAGQNQSEEWTYFLQQQCSVYYTHLTTTFQANPGHVSSLPTTDYSQPFLASRDQCQQPFGDDHSNEQSQWHLSEQEVPVYPQCHSSDQRSVHHSMHSRMDELVNIVSTSSLESERAPGMNMVECGQPCLARKNKVLPPPTLPPILPPTISNPASLSLGSTEPNTSKSSLTATTRASDCQTSTDESLSNAWPKLDGFFFPDHCCRTSACRSTNPGLSSSSSRTKSEKKNGGPLQKGGNNKTKKPFISELPPPPPKSNQCQHGDGDGFLALSASIWGNGWHQVEPLPASFIKTVQKCNLIGYGCEREHKRRHQRQRRDSGHAQCNGAFFTQEKIKSPGGVGGGGGGEGGGGGGGGGDGHRQKFKQHQQGSKNKATAEEASSWATVCSSRLPRSLQFID